MASINELCARIERETGYPVPDWTNRGVKLTQKPRKLTSNLEQLMRAGQHLRGRIAHEPCAPPSL